MKLTVKKKLLSGFMTVAFLMVLSSAFSFYVMKKIDASYYDLVERRAAVVKNTKEMQNLASREIGNLRAVLLHEADAVSSLREVVDQLDAVAKQTKPMLQSRQHQVMIDQLVLWNKQFRDQAERVIALSETNVEEARIDAAHDVFPIARQIRELADKLGAEQQKLMDEGSLANTRMVATFTWAMLALNILSVVLAVAIGMGLARLISRPIVRMSKAAASIAAGDLTVERLVVKNRDEIGELANAFNQMAENLREVIRHVGHSAEQVAASAEELTASAEQTSNATNQIVSSIQQIASGAEAQGQGLAENARAMKEMATGIQQVAETASGVSDAAVDAMAAAKQGNESLERVIQQMNVIHHSVDDTAAVIRRLEERSREIDHITQMITEIANQTNLLALNAAIEAARAGEQGRGFAVVADEVRKLAEQSRDSAEQINRLIQDIKQDTIRAVDVMEKGTREAEEGLVLVDESKKGFETILMSIQQVTEQIQEASAVAQQMSASVEEVNASTDEIARLAQESTQYSQSVAAASEEQLASMEEITASAESLAQMAEELRLTIRKFRL